MIRFDEIVNDESLHFIQKLESKFGLQRKKLLQQRIEKQAKIDNGIFPNFLDETKHVRQSDWKVLPCPDDLLDRRVEITGPVDRKMIINALKQRCESFYG